ncbi:MAG: tetratricopeptide repeat protein [Chlorogloeopsis fritschii C42_A2020_084]|uniref:CHAT domain-containing protein n=1 Tax=Chlorogloeopsis fritschii TaxID=1124 RepID=UPI0019FC038A|nr:tetratricopeptide repeat protein [Chlorogloeopsis fritschii]MBF2004252.1 tetratricopeptide repeat protein [Chlorogloeopsis fritschii C42_A2020_084]
MLKWLVRWLKRFRQSPKKKRYASARAVTAPQVVKKPPELTNADLEYLFTQLLEGVYQARGKYWAIKYLQRMEHRISVDRWIEWLLDFGEKLLTSPAPNNQLAERMVQLGELGIGTVGDLAYDLGIRLLTRNLGEEYWEDLETTQAIPIPVPPPNTELPQQQDVEITTSAASSFSTPGIELIRNFGERLWEDEEDVSQITQNSFVTALQPVKEDTANISPNLINFGEEEGAWIQETLTADDLLVSWEQSNNFAQQLAVELEVPSTNSDPIIGAVSDRSDRITTQAQAYFYQALQQAKNGDLATAMTHYDKALELKPDVCEYWFNRGLTLFYLGNFTEAIASYDKVLEIKPDFYKGWYNKGAALSELGYFADALACFHRALELKPDYQQAYSGWGLMQLKLGYLPEAIFGLDQALLLQPQDSLSWYWRGVAFAENGQHHDAIASYDRAIESDPQLDLAWYNRGLALSNLGCWEDAIANYYQATEINPDCHEAWYALGSELEKLANWADAVKAYDRATQINPDFHDVWVDRGVALANLGRWQDAIASWDRAIAIKSDFYLTWFNRGVASDNLGRREEAIASYYKAIELKPDFHLIWYNLGVAQSHLKRFEEAIASYDQALLLQPDFWEAWLGRGNAAGGAVNFEGLVQQQSHINPALNERGYDGRLASYQEGLRYISPTTHPEGWATLYLASGNAHYEQGKQHSPPRYYWLQAATAYEQALYAFTAEGLTLLHLEVLQNLIKTLVVLGEKAPAHEYQQRAIYLLQSLLNESDRTDESKKQLVLKFAGIAQLTVDIAILYGDLAPGWEILEQGKNACLNWLLYGWTDEIYSPTYADVHQLLNPTTAIVCWHITPCTLRTFVIKYNSPEPIPIFTPVLNFDSIDELPVPEAVARLIEFEKWVQEWNKQYQEYRRVGEDEQSKSKHSWRLDMERRLLQLKNILNISATIQELEDITQLILIPHRDLHAYPLHALFHLAAQEESSNLNANFKITYLPTAQIGLFLKAKFVRQTDELSLLSVEQPNSTDYSRQKFAKIEAELISQLFDNCQRIPESQATKQQVKNALSGDRNLLHFIGQLTENLIHPHQSALLLAHDKLTLEEICKNSLVNYKLITLSASETAMSYPQSITTEYVSLAHAFLSLGVPYVVNNLWTVDSAAAALVMIEFYRRIKLNQSITTAFLEATAWLRELTAGQMTKWYEDAINQLPAEELRIRTHLAAELHRSSQMAADKKLYHHPYYWAGFKLTGNLS